jgi:hypothetical protein
MQSKFEGEGASGMVRDTVIAVIAPPDSAALS